MKRMRRIAIFALLASVAAAQNASELFNRAPKSIDDALRARIGEFYQLHVKGDFRHAEMLVAEDTKDYFYSHDKPQYLSFEIVRIEYSDGYTRAKATVSVEQRVMFPGFAGKAMKIPTPSYWKIEDGKWCWYVDQDKLNDSPFGHMKAGPPGSDDTTPAAILSGLPTDADQLLNMIRVDKSQVVVGPGESERVVVENALKGPVTLSIEGKLPGIEASLDHLDVPASGKATLIVKVSEGAKSGTITVRAMPLGKMMPIQITVK